VKISTRQFGIIDIDEKKILTMKPEMPGFPGKKKYILIEHEALEPFLFYQSIDDQGLCFILMNPYTFMPDYKVDIKDKMNELGWCEDNDVFVYVIINAASNDPKLITANLIGPVLINTTSNVAAQIVLNNNEYSHKYRVLK
jgi:flagellar assembly factor FliW